MKAGLAMQELDEQGRPPDENGGPGQGLRKVRQVCGASRRVLPRVLILVCATLMVVGLAPLPPASADISACASVLVHGPDRPVEGGDACYCCGDCVGRCGLTVMKVHRLTGQHLHAPRIGGPEQG